MPNERIRENLYNIEQYKADALSIIEKKEKKKGPVKTHANGNPMNGSSITGKNPFAILKASAIASPTSATFPNNF